MRLVEFMPYIIFFFNDTATTEIYTLSLHDALPILLGVDVGLSEDVVLWRAFLQGLVARGLRGVKLVISDAHVGLKQAIKEVFLGAAWQRCRVHTIRTQSGRRSSLATRLLCATA